MVTREKIKREIDNIPNDLLEKVHKYIGGLTSKKTIKKKFHTYKLNGQFDDINIRERAYE